jgi:hypothetical protein
MQFKKIISVSNDDNSIPFSVNCTQTAQLFVVEGGGTGSYHWALNGCSTAVSYMYLPHNLKCNDYRFRTGCTYGFCLILTININHLSKKPQPLDLFKGHALCFLYVGSFG